MNVAHNAERVPAMPYIDPKSNIKLFQAVGSRGLEKGFAVGKPPFGSEASTYAAVNYMSNPLSSSVFVANTGCGKGSLNVDNVCVTGGTETKPINPKSEIQDLIMRESFQNKPYLQLNETDVATMLRAAPLT